MLPNNFYDLIKKPIITEKSSEKQEIGKYVFCVNSLASKVLLKKAIEFVFDVKVKKINTIRVLGKVKNFKGRIGTRASYKKAVVTLQEGYSIDFARGAK